MEIMKIGNKTWRNAVIHQICWSFFTTNVFYCTVLCYAAMLLKFIYYAQEQEFWSDYYAIYV